MRATVSWRVIELGGTSPVLILDLINPDKLQAALRQWWPNCRVTYDKRSWAKLIVRKVPYTGVQSLIAYLARTYRISVTGDRISRSMGEYWQW